MMTIEEEIEHLFTFISHPAGFNVDMCGLLCIRPINEASPPTFWEVDWEDEENGTVMKFHKEFVDLRAACVFYVERRRLMCLGLDFEALAYSEQGIE
jgi:hypothetical protein